MLLVHEAFYGVTRFDDFVDRVGVSDPVTTQRLKELVVIGALATQPYREPGRPTRHEYVLTQTGHDLMPVVLAIAQWGARHLPGGAPALTHDGCGRPVRIAPRCEAGHDVAEDELRVTATR